MMKTGKISLIAGALTLAAGAAWSQPFSAWGQSRVITLNTSATGANVSGNVRNFPVLIRLGSAESTIFAQSKLDGSDVRFAKSNDSALAFQIEHWDSAGQRAAIWVKVDTVHGNNATQSIKMYWSNSGASALSSGAAVFDTANGYKAVLHMNEAAGNVTDATVNAVTGTNTGTTTTAGIAGRARNLGGTNAANTDTEDERQMISLGTPDALNFGGPITLSAWVRWLNVAPTEGSSTYRTALWRGSAGGGEVFVRIGTAGSPEYYAGRWTGSSSLTTGTIGTAPASGDSATWIHLAGSYDGSHWRLFRNGVLVGQSEEDLDGPQTPPTAWHIGRSGIGSNLNNRWWAGDVDEVRISRVARDTNYMKLTYQSQKLAQTLTNIATVATVPRAPTGVIATPGAANSGTIVVSWSPPEENGGSAITGYTAFAVSDPAKSCATTTALTCSIGGLTANTLYAFSVRATNGVGNSLPSPASELTSTVGLARGVDNQAFRVTAGDRPYSFRVPAGYAAERVTVTVSDVHGRTVWRTSVMPSATQAVEVSWNGMTASGEKAAAGMYLARIRVEGAGKALEDAQGGAR